MQHVVTALEMLRQGDWNGAHAIAQDDQTPTGAWLHGIVHIVEGDEENARYWYRRAGRAFPGMAAADAEMQAIEDAATS